MLSSEKIEVNKQDDRGNTPLHLAAARGNIEKVTLLLKSKKVDINVKNNGGMTALQMAENYNEHAVKKVLLALPGIQGGQSVIDKAIIVTSLNSYVEEASVQNKSVGNSMHAFLRGRRVAHGGRAKVLMTELKNTDLSMKHKQALIEDQLSKFDNNKASGENQPYKGCPTALSKRFKWPPSKKEPYYQILKDLSDKLIPEKDSDHNAEQEQDQQERKGSGPSV